MPSSSKTTEHLLRVDFLSRGNILYLVARAPHRARAGLASSLLAGYPSYHPHESRTVRISPVPNLDRARLRLRVRARARVRVLGF